MKAPNLITLTDSYKVTHWKQYPPGTEKVYSYFESRLPDDMHMPNVVFFGLQYYLKEYLLGQVVTKEKIDEAEDFFAQHFMRKDLFNRAGWEHILNKHGGRLPVSIKAVAEGTVVPRSNVLMTIENTDPACYWLPNYLETLLVQVWYGSTVATQSREMKMILLNFFDKTGSDKSLIDFKLHDFGFRGVSSVETAGVGGAAHLVSFKGTDTVAGLLVARDYYNCPMAGYSIPAAEHSTITSWGKENELKAYENMLDQYPTGLVAVVSDSYDLGFALHTLWGDKLKHKVLNRDGTLVVRPDSGEPDRVVLSTLQVLAQKFGFTLNAKKKKVLNPKVRVIQGDGINLQSMHRILEVTSDEFASENIAFGSGGALLQKLHRDTLRFAFKCSSIVVNGQERPVFKNPVGDKNKRSKGGRLKLVQSPTGLVTVKENEAGDDILTEVFRDGELLVDNSFDEIRELAFVE
jgi:nicotinamide phosphoribosyltransferase